MAVIKWIIIISAILNYGFMAFDGGRSLVTGDYIRPKSGKYAGQLGPWSKVVEKVGIDPESNFMKGIFVFIGLCGLIFSIAFAFELEWAWKGMVIISIGSLWYLVPGSALSV